MNKLKVLKKLIHPKYQIISALLFIGLVVVTCAGVIAVDRVAKFIANPVPVYAVSYLDTKIAVKTLKSTVLSPEIGTKAWAMQKWANRFNKKVAWQLEVIMDTGESGWDADAHHCNTNGTVDLSWYQINSVHVDSGKLSLACAADPICSTDFAMDLYEEQAWCPWYGAKKLGFCK